jgi:hypothetical protein
VTRARPSTESIQPLAAYVDSVKSTRFQDYQNTKIKDSDAFDKMKRDLLERYDRVESLHSFVKPISRMSSPSSQKALVDAMIISRTAARAARRPLLDGGSSGCIHDHVRIQVSQFFGRCQKPHAMGE